MSFSIDITARESNVLYTSDEGDCHQSHDEVTLYDISWEW